MEDNIKIENIGRRVKMGAWLLAVSSTLVLIMLMGFAGSWIKGAHKAKVKNRISNLVSSNGLSEKLLADSHIKILDRKRFADIEKTLGIYFYIKDEKYDSANILLKDITFSDARIGLIKKKVKKLSKLNSKDKKKHEAAKINLLLSIKSLIVQQSTPRVSALDQHIYNMIKKSL